VLVALLGRAGHVSWRYLVGDATRIDAVFDAQTRRGNSLKL
jgi:hypothetical protein